MVFCVFTGVPDMPFMFPFREIGSTNKAMAPWLFAQKGKYNNMCCPLGAIRPSPTQVPSALSLCLCSSGTNRHTEQSFKSLRCFHVFKSDCVPDHGRQNTETSVSSSSRWVQTARIKPSVSAWGNTKAAPVLWWGRLTPATYRPRPRRWSASFRSSSGAFICF